ncbi:C-type lectin 1 [Aphelenchoides avenae]|nr:C-type lectin 1 [Aphelenchus avenae]
MRLVCSEFVFMCCLAVVAGKCIFTGLRCPEGWSTYAGSRTTDGIPKCNKVIDYAKGYDAEDGCKAVGGEPVSIHSSAENDFVAREMLDCHEPVFARLGCRDTFSWTDGSKLDFSNYGFAERYASVALGDFYGHCYMNVNPIVAPFGGFYVQYGRYANEMMQPSWTAPVAACQLVFA